MKANQARNEKDLIQMIKPALRVAVDYVIKEIEMQNKILMQSEIYYSGFEPSVYNRSFEFQQAWDTAVHSTSALGKNNVVQGSFFYAPSKMKTSNPPVHASFLNGEDSREYLAEIIYEGLAGDFTGEYTYAHENPIFNYEEWTKKRNVWEALNKWLGKKTIKQLFEQGLREAGLQYRSHSTPIKRTIT